MIKKKKKNHFIWRTREYLKFHRLSGATFYDWINTIYQFIKSFLDTKWFEEYGAFKGNFLNLSLKCVLCAFIRMASWRRFLLHTQYTIILLKSEKTSLNAHLSHDLVLWLTLKALRKTASENVVCLCRLLNILADFSNLFLHTGKQYGPRSDCSWSGSTLFAKMTFKITSRWQSRRQ